MRIVEFHQVSKSFGHGANQVYALKNINFSIEKGDFVAIIGQSGSGKSTLMNLIGCLDTPTSGIYQVNGADVGKMTPEQLAYLRCSTFGFVFQRYNLLNNLSAVENTALPAVYAGVNRHQRNQQATSLLKELQLEEKVNSKPNELSGGQQQRVSIARALMNGGEVILADEPTGALDSKSGEMVLTILKTLHQQGHTIILVTHDKNIAQQASRVIELKDGEIIADTRKSSEFYPSAPKIKARVIGRFSQFKYSLLESLGMSIHAIVSHKLRSILTMLGIIIGIASVVSVVALGSASEAKIMADISSMGTNTIDIWPGTSFGDMRSGRIKTLTISDSEFLAEQSFLDSATPNVAIGGTLLYKNYSLTARATGVGHQFFAVKGRKIAQGRNFSRDELQQMAAVVVIDDNTKKELFAQVVDPIGEVVLFNRKPLTVIGVTEKDNSSRASLSAMNIWFPYTTAMYRINGSNDINSITVKVSDQVISQVAEDSITNLLISRHGKKDFFVINSDSIKQTIQSATQTMTFLIACIAVISLIVGGIGVMNIMLVSVTERTREIGIRMAIGAKPNDILKQFLIEAILICLVGGLMGVGLSLLIGMGFNSLAKDFAMHYSPAATVLALLCSSAIGIIFGYMPARNASKLNPIEALARE